MSRANNRSKLIGLLGMANVKDFPNSEELNAIIALHNQLVANNPKKEVRKRASAKKEVVKAEGAESTGKGFAVRKPTGETIAMASSKKVEEKKVAVSEPETEVTL